MFKIPTGTKSRQVKIPKLKIPTGQNPENWPTLSFNAARKFWDFQILSFGQMDFFEYIVV
jgi:hypothetical protein